MRKYLWLPIFLLLSGCNQLDSILYEPRMTPQQWCEMQPCVKFGSGFTLSQPSSSSIVYFLALLSIAVGFYFLKIWDRQKSRRWWGIALALVGFAAVLAGTSYQAFGYELKCAGRDLCIWTNWWEVVYNILTVGGINAMLVAVAYSCTSGKWRKLLVSYAGINFGAHFISTLVGVAIPNKFLISFELLVLFSAPTLLFVLGFNAWRYFKSRDRMELALWGSWILLFAMLLAYFLYLSLGITQQLWQQGIWFSENDVLHIVGIIWTLYLPLFMIKWVKDAA